MENHKVHVYEHFNQRRNDEVKRLFSGTTHIKWDPVKLEKYAHQFDWEALSANPNLTPDARIFLAYPDKWNMYKASPRVAAMENKSDFALLASRFKDKLNWSVLSRSKHLDSVFVEAFIDYIDWQALCTNPHFIWEKLFIDRYKDSIDWDLFSEKVRPRSFKIVRYMAQHFKSQSEQKINDWFVGLISRYESLWNWKKLSQNTNIGSSPIIIDTFIDKWDWKCLMENRGFEWTAELLEKYAGYLPKLDSESIEKTHLWRCLIQEEYLKVCDDDLEMLIDHLFEELRETD